jgi:antitoxin VapB
MSSYRSRFLRVWKSADRLIVEPMPRPSLLELLSTWDSLDEELPEIDDLEPVEDVDL